MMIRVAKGSSGRQNKGLDLRPTIMTDNQLMAFSHNEKKKETDVFMANKAGGQSRVLRAACDKPCRRP